MIIFKLYRQREGGSRLNQLSLSHEPNRKREKTKQKKTYELIKFGNGRIIRENSPKNCCTKTADNFQTVYRDVDLFSRTLPTVLKPHSEGVEMTGM